MPINTGYPVGPINLASPTHWLVQAPSTGALSITTTNPTTLAVGEEKWYFTSSGSGVFRAMYQSRTGSSIGNYRRYEPMWQVDLPPAGFIDARWWWEFEMKKTANTNPGGNTTGSVDTNFVTLSNGLVTRNNVYNTGSAATGGAYVNYATTNYYTISTGGAINSVYVTASGYYGASYAVNTTRTVNLGEDLRNWYIRSWVAPVDVSGSGTPIDSPEAVGGFDGWRVGGM